MRRSEKRVYSTGDNTEGRGENAREMNGWRRRRLPRRHSRGS